MKAVERQAIEDIWVHIFDGGLQNSDGKSKGLGAILTNQAKQAYRGLRNGLDAITSFFEEQMAVIFAWLCVIATSVILILLAIALLKAAFMSGPDRRKEILEVLWALPLLLWSFLEFFMILFKILPKPTNKSRTCVHCAGCGNTVVESEETDFGRPRSLSQKWRRLREGMGRV